MNEMHRLLKTDFEQKFWQKTYHFEAAYVDLGLQCLEEPGHKQTFDLHE